MLQTCVVGDNYYWLHNQPKILRKSDVSKMFSEKSIFANFHVHFQYIQICEGALILWRHSDDIWNLMVLILVWMDRASPGLKKTRPLIMYTYLMKAWKQWNGSYVGGVDIYISNSFDYEFKKKKDQSSQNKIFESCFIEIDRSNDKRQSKTKQKQKQNKTKQNKTLYSVLYRLHYHMTINL